LNPKIILGKKKFWLEKNFGTGKFFGSEQIFKTRKKCFYQKNFLSLKKNVVHEKIFGPKKFGQEKNLCPKKMCAPKKFWSEKNFGLKFLLFLFFL